MSQITGGAMAAIIGLDTSQVHDYLHADNCVHIDVANDNAPKQSVLSGRAEDIAHAQTVFEQHGAMVIPLNVSGAFHSRYMQGVQDEFAHFLNAFSFHTPHIPVIANVTAKPYQI